MNQALFQKLTTDLWYSVRRYYVDEFFMRRILLFIQGQKILDMGGKKTNKRGVFDIEQYGLEVKYANLSMNTQPDFLCDIVHVPVADHVFDGVILAEVLEHVPAPKAVLQEAYRVLKPGGSALICTPFMLHVHADPYDFARYTEYWYQTVLTEIGFTSIVIEKQGLFFSVLANMFKFWAYEWSKIGRPRQFWQKILFYKFVYWFLKKAMILEQNSYYQEHAMFGGYTTGYGIVCSK